MWLKVDTGMHRLGVLPEEFEPAYARLSASRNIKQPFGIMTHLATADSDAVVAQQQIDLFSALTQNLNNPTSIGNSAVIFGHNKISSQLVRPGIVLYGVSPFADRTAESLGLKPVMTLTSRVITTKKIKSGERVGYGATWQAQQDSLIGIVGVGYGDGYPRHAPTGTPVLINGEICPLVGRVSMDMLAVDLSSAPATQTGDRVILWGEGLPVEQVAQSSQTIAYELFCQLGARVERTKSAIKA